MCRYAFSGETRKETGEERREVHCFKASLSEHDLDHVGGLSPRAWPRSASTHMRCCAVLGESSTYLVSAVRRQAEKTIRAPEEGFRFHPARARSARAWHLPGLP